MRRFIACLLAAGCGMGMDQGTSGGGSSGAPDGGGSGAPDAGPPTSSQSSWLDPQNAVRANAKPAPSPALQPFSWSDGAAQVAEAWAANCVYQHNAGRGFRGENIAANTPSGSWSPSNVVAAWAGEVSDYDYPTNSCAAGKECGHYTQIVWRGTTSVGCAKMTCTKNSPFGNSEAWDFWVCDYEPPGNFVGQKPY